ncbi:phospholipase effector Tle1 domain-containing protein [Marinobacter sp. 1Y8]
MSKAIVICCDGTWNQPETESKSTVPSNILKCVRALKAHSGRRDQVVFYDEGIGNRGGVDRWLGGLLGVGLSANLIQAYRFIAHNWAPGDDIYLLGFSRGAYTVRSLAGFIHMVGLIGKSEIKHLPDAYRWYRASPGDDRDNVPNAALVEELRQSSRRIPIRFLGVFDTVGALGLPVPGLRRLSRPWIGFHDTQLSDSVSYAVQALAIDELRSAFKPDLWTHSPDATRIARDSTARRTLQVWLPGVHGDVGGGYPDAALADIALQFMIGQANQQGLEWQVGSVFSSDPNDRFMGELHDSYRLPYRLMSPHERVIGEVQREAKSMESAVTEKIHIAALDRLEAGGAFHNGANLRQALSQGCQVFHERRHLRLTLPESLSVADMPDVGEVCTLLDMSESGARLYYSGNGSVSAGGDVRLRHPRIGDRTAKVKWCTGSEVGVEFAA